MHTPLERMPFAAPVIVLTAVGGLLFRLGHHLWQAVDDALADFDEEPFA